MEQPSGLEQAQATNMHLTKTLYNHLNHQDWKAAQKLCAQTVRYRGRVTHFAEVDGPKATATFVGTADFDSGRGSIM